jgi:magnesium transporter
MIATCHQIDDTLKLTQVALEGAADACQSSEARIWLDLQDFESSELEAWLDKLGVRDLSRRLCLEALDRSGFYPLKNEIFLVVRIIPKAQNTGEADHIAFLCRENLLLTVHEKPVSRLEQLAMEQASADWLSERSIAGFVSALMIALSIECLKKASDLRTSLVALQERMESEPNTVQVEEILEMRSEYLVLDRVLSDQLPCVHGLSKTDKSFFKLKDSQDYLNCAIANLEAADKASDRLDKRIIALRSAFQMNAQDKTNRRLGILTILSAIFMPLTFMAGIWGMNFEGMPELKHPFAYPSVLGAMIIIASIMYLYFRKSGWFD